MNVSSSPILVGNLYGPKFRERENEKRGDLTPWENGRKEGASRAASVNKFLHYCLNVSYIFHRSVEDKIHFRAQLKTHLDALNFHQGGDYANNFRAKFILPFESEYLLVLALIFV